MTGGHVINHDEAHQLAVLKREESNLARCYLQMRERIAELEAVVKAIASRDVPNPGWDWAEVEFAAAACDRLGIAYETKWDQ